jgi:hypothetical protein
LKERFEDGWMDGGKNQSIHFERKDLMDGWMDGWMETQFFHHAKT